MRAEEWTPTRSRVEATRQGRDRLDYLFFWYFFIVNKWTTETSFICSIKYCYLQYLCCLLCNPTAWVHQIKARTQWNIARSKDWFYQRHKHKHKFSERKYTHKPRKTYTLTPCAPNTNKHNKSVGTRKTNGFVSLFPVFALKLRKLVIRTTSE